jgi:signal transduction histidine kinase
MNITITARPWRLLLSACVVAAVFTVVMGGIGMVVTSTTATLLLPFVAAALSVAGLTAVMPWIDRLDQRCTPAPTTTALAEAPPAIQTGSLEQVLTGLAQVLAEGTRAQCAIVWLAVAEKLVSAASYPPRDDLPARTIANLAALLTAPEVDHAVPVLDGSVLRAALTVGKPGRPVTPADQRLMQDIAQGAGLLLRGAQLTTELEERVRRADELASQLQASRQRLTRAREVERQRLVSELTQVTTTRLATLRSDVAEIQDLLSRGPTESERTQQALARARTGLDELLDRFRVIARGVYPAVLRSQGPAGALEELAADLPRPVRVSGRPSRRLSWEVESGIYWLAASAMQQLASSAAEQPLRVHLEHTKGRLAVRVEDPVAAMAAGKVFAALADDVDRLAALGGDVEIISDGAGGITLRAWLPDQLEPSVEAP